MKRSPTSATRTADLVPRGWIPGLLAALLLLAYTLARPGPALVALAGILLLSRPLEAQRPTAGGRALAAGAPPRAAAAFRKAARGGGSDKDTPVYNAGPAALQAGRLEVARGALAEAAKSLDPDLRYRALYNLGLVGLLAARSDTARADELLDDAADRLRQALLLKPNSARAKWNLELTERRRPPPPPQSGGGATPPPTGGPQSPQPKPAAPESKDLSQSQAEQILNSMERRERETREEQQRRMQSGSAGGVKDW